MRFALVCFCVLEAIAVNGRLFIPSDFNLTNNNFPSIGLSKTFHNSAPFAHGRRRTLFARRGRQRVSEMKPGAPQATPKEAPLKAGQIPVQPKCSKMSESCLQHSRCCDSCASCHCRFFNTICLCRKINSSCQRKT